MHSSLHKKLDHHLNIIYPNQNNDDFIHDIIDVFYDEQTLQEPRSIDEQPWNEKTHILITYADSIQKTDGTSHLKTLTSFLDNHLKSTMTSVHLLPFFPFSSDDGFAVKDYYEVRDDLGDWDDIQSLSKNFMVMSDVVINHASAQSEWFIEFLNENPDYADFFVTENADTDVSQVVRPRTSPLLIPFETQNNGVKNVWCTFGPDQVDFNFKNPKVLMAFLKMIRFYLDKNIRIFRLDAVGFLWKELGTSCIHLPQTHEVIRLIRTLCDYYADPVVIITETNVPNQENLTYFGNQNEAHMIYNFSLPPLLLHALLSGKRRYLKKWLMAMPPVQEGCTYFNFTASHDGIGLRPATGLLSDKHRSEMMDTVKKFGGKISMRKGPDGEDSPYEMNIALFDAMKGTIENGEDGLQRDRFLASQTIMMELEGVPAFYIHSLLATPNDYEKHGQSGANRCLNRHQWDDALLQEKLNDPQSDQSVILSEIKRLISIRSQQTCFHPNATQFVLQLDEGLFGLWRQSLDRKQNMYCVTNIWDKDNVLPLSDLNLYSGTEWHDLLTDKVYTDWDEDITLKPYQTVWISNRW